MIDAFFHKNENNFKSTMNLNKPNMIVFLEGYKSLKFNGPFTESLYEHGKYNDIRVLLTEQPLYILTAPSDVITPKIRVSVGLSEVTVFRIIPNQTPIQPSEMVYFGMMRITDTLELHLFPMPFSDIFVRASVFFNNEPIIVLDLDKTLVITEHDIPFLDESFMPHFSISGKTIIEDARFEHRIMIRPECHIFLTYLFKLTSKVYILTASDLNYAEQVIQSANECGWGGGKGAVSFPLSQIYSVRNKPLTALPKTFTRIIPLKLCDKKPICIGVDDSLTAWDASLLHDIIPIAPFNSIKETHVLLEVANFIHERITK